MKFIFTSNDLLSSTFTVFGSFDNTGQVQQL